MEENYKAKNSDEMQKILEIQKTLSDISKQPLRIIRENQNQRRNKMELTVDDLWADLINCVHYQTDIATAIINAGIEFDARKCKALREICDGLLGISSMLYDRVLEIKTKSFFIEKTENNKEG